MTDLRDTLADVYADRDLILDEMRHRVSFEMAKSALDRIVTVAEGLARERDTLLEDLKQARYMDREW